MKRRMINRVLMVLIVFLSVVLLVNNKVIAKNEVNNTPYNTYSVGLDGKLNSSPLAYEGVNVINIGLNNPQDIFIDDNNIAYIADKGAKVVYIYNISNASVSKVGEGELLGPQGVFVDKDGNIFVADEKSVFKFSSAGIKLKEYLRPTEALFGENSQYRPTKVVDRNGNIFITSEGNSNGIVQLNSAGEFMGYFGPNNVNLTISLFIKRLFLAKEDRETYASLSPKATTNLAIDYKNIVYTVIDGEAGVSLKKYNISGSNVLAKDSFFSSSYKDITVDKNGFIYTVDNSSDGVIQVMDPEGNLLFCFGSTKGGSSMVGEFDSARGIAIDKNENIWVLDSGGKSIQVFRKTLFASTVTKAILAYNEGDYDNAQKYYEEIIRQNATFVSAYVGIGKIAQRLEDYDKAIEYFKLANYKAGYSEVYWELRDNWFNKNLVWMIIVVLILVVFKIFHLYSRLWHLLKIDLSKFKEKISKSKLVGELKYLIKILKKPKDVFYDIKFGLAIRSRTAWGLFIVFIIINIIGDYFVRGYLFRTTDASNMNFAFELLRWGLVILLFVIGNYLISSLQNGEGFFRDVFIGTIFSFAPIILFKIPVDLISNFLTYNESYLYQILNGVLWTWSIINLIIMISQIHNYKFGEFNLNVILTFLAVVVMVLLYLVFYILTMQFVDFIIGLVSEGVYRT